MKFRNQKKIRAMSLVEMLFAISLISLVCVGLYASLANGFAVTKVFRENLRATQILVQRMENIRLYRWSQLNDSAYLPANFVEYYDPIGRSNGSGGVMYIGKITKAVPTNLPSAYRTNMRAITVEVTWSSGNITRKRQLETYVARSGLQNYLLK